LKETKKKNENGGIGLWRRDRRGGEKRREGN